MSFTWPDKDPNEILRYTHDWSARLDGETIDNVDAIFETTDPPTTVQLERPTSFISTVQTVWLEGGVVGEKINLTLRCTTTTGQVFDERINFKIKNR